MQRRSAKNRHSNARTPAETKMRELSGRKSPQKRAIRRRAGNARFAKTGWWCAQSDTNPSPVKKGGITGINRANLRISAHLASHEWSKPHFYRPFQREFPRDVDGNFSSNCGKKLTRARRKGQRREQSG